MDTNRLGTMPEPKLSKESEHNLVFKPITLDSLSEIEPFLHRQCYRTCDFSIGGIYMWVDYFGYEYCISQDTLFIKGNPDNEVIRYGTATYAMNVGYQYTIHVT